MSQRCPPQCSHGVLQTGHMQQGRVGRENTDRQEEEKEMEQRQMHTTPQHGDDTSGGPRCCTRPRAAATMSMPPRRLFRRRFLIFVFAPLPAARLRPPHAATFRQALPPRRYSRRESRLRRQPLTRLKKHNDNQNQSVTPRARVRGRHARIVSACGARICAVLCRRPRIYVEIMSILVR